MSHKLRVIKKYLSKPAIGDMTMYATAIIMKSIPTRTSFEAPDTPDWAKRGSKNGILKSIPDQGSTDQNRLVQHNLENL